MDILDYGFMINIFDNLMMAVFQLRDETCHVKNKLQNFIVAQSDMQHTIRWRNLRCSKSNLEHFYEL